MCFGDVKVTESSRKSIFVLGYLLLRKGSPKLSVSIPSARLMFVIHVNAQSEATGGGGGRGPETDTSKTLRVHKSPPPPRRTRPQGRMAKVGEKYLLPSTWWLTSHFNPNLLRQSFVSTTQSLLCGFNFLLITERKGSRQSDILMLGSLEYSTGVTRTLEKMKQWDLISTRLLLPAQVTCRSEVTSKLFICNTKSIRKHRGLLKTPKLRRCSGFYVF